MSTFIKKRLWCSKHKEWELHTIKIGSEELSCDSCGTHYKPSNTIPMEKILEQRKRYSESKTNALTAMFSRYAKAGYGGSFGGGLLENLFNEDIGETHIEEYDAGQKKIDEEKKIEREKKIREAQIQRQKDLELKATFHKLGRNDTCLCEEGQKTGKKYKRCCWNKIYKI